MPLSVRKVPVDQLVAEGHWSAGLFCGPAAELVGTKLELKRLDEITKKLVEGWRLPADEAETVPLYRQRNLEALRIVPDLEHWTKPTQAAPWCVRSGDVVLNKIPPIRAALVSSRLHRHPIDSNCVLIRGLTEAQAFWLALCLKQPPYQEFLLQRSSSPTLPRISLSTLRQLPLHPVPDGAQALASKILECGDAMLENASALADLLQEVEGQVADGLELLKSETEGRHSLTKGQRYPPDDVGDSLVPKAVQLAHVRNALMRTLGWRPIAEFTASKQVSTHRLMSSAVSLRYLRLSDATPDLSFTLPDESDMTQGGRVFGEPVLADEVLISTLVSAPRVVFVAEQPSANLHIVDHWVRLRFQETPGAWALLLNTTVVREQLKGMAIGTVQQFTNPANVLGLVAPVLSAEILTRWDLAIRRHHDRKRELDLEWATHLRQAQDLYERVHTFVTARPEREPIIVRRQEAALTQETV
jgi:hypothetical protein